MSRSRSHWGDAGETLIEILVAIVVLGIAATGLIAGLSTGIFASDSHRRLSSAESVLRAYGELVKTRVIHPATTTLTADVPAFSNGDNLTLQVASTSAFTDSGQYTISLDGVVMLVKNQTGTSFSVTAQGGGSARSGATVQRYESCPRASYWDGVATSHPELSTTANRLGVPTVTSVTFFDSANNSMTPAQCDTFFNDVGKTTCSLSGDHRTACDPPWMRVDVSVTSTDVGRTKASVATSVIIRRIP